MCTRVVQMDSFISSNLASLIRDILVGIKLIVFSLYLLPCQTASGENLHSPPMHHTVHRQRIDMTDICPWS